MQIQTGLPVVWWTLAFVVAAFGPIGALYLIGDRLWRVALLEAHISEADHAPEHNTLVPAILGILERVLYMAAFLYGKGEVVGLWFVLRSAGGWSRWADGFKDPQDGKKHVPGRTIFNTFCIGFATSLLFALGCYLCLQWALAGDLYYALGGVLITLVSVYVLAWFIVCRYLARKARAA